MKRCLSGQPTCPWAEREKHRPASTFSFCEKWPSFEDKTNTRTYGETSELTQHAGKIKDTPCQPPPHLLLLLLLPIPTTSSFGWPLTLSVERLRQVEGMECSVAIWHKVSAERDLPSQCTTMAPLRLAKGFGLFSAMKRCFECDPQWQGTHFS